MNLAENQGNVQAIKSWIGTGAINIFGLPFSGKDTQANLLAKAIGAPVIAGGDILRSHPDQTKIRELMATGKLFPSDFYLGVILPYLSRAEYTDRPLVLSSVGRWHGEEDIVMEAAKKSGHPIKAAVFLKMPEEEVRKRYTSSRENRDRGVRHDDVEQLIDIRLDEFRNKTLPVINYYRHHGLLIEVDGSKSKRDVAKLIVSELSKKAAT